MTSTDAFSDGAVYGLEEAVDPQEHEESVVRAPRFAPPPMFGRHVHLRVVQQDDERGLRLLDLGQELGVRWRFRGATPTPTQWSQAVSASLVQLLIVPNSNPTKPLGIANAYGHSFQDQYCHVGVAAFTPRPHSPLLMLGATIFLNYVFRCWSFRKVYLEVAEYNVPQIAGGIGRLLELESRLREHQYYDGRYWDRLTFAIYRQKWEERAPRLLAAALPTPPRIATVHIPKAS